MHTQSNLHSQRIAARLKLDVAQDFVGETFYFPHNLDFRGRTYAVGPHLQYLGDDLTRGLLQFAEAKPLGPDGLRWLKVQLANLYGMDKLSLDDRVKWSDEQIEAGILREVDAQPMGSVAMDWWTKADNPVQTLALCFDLHAALEAPDPAAYESPSAVHMDGSCNGLQHYAALGRDTRGAEQVRTAGANSSHMQHMSRHPPNSNSPVHSTLPDSARRQPYLQTQPTVLPNLTLPPPPNAPVLPLTPRTPRARSTWCPRRSRRISTPACASLSSKRWRGWRRRPSRRPRSWRGESLRTAPRRTSCTRRRSTGGSPGSLTGTSRERSSSRPS